MVRLEGEATDMRRAAKSKPRRCILVLTLAIVLALVVAAGASAAVWKDGGVEVKNLREFDMVGGEIFETSEGNGMLCGIEARIQIVKGAESGLTRYIWDGQPCEGFGNFSGCEVTKWTTSGFPLKIKSLTSASFLTEQKFTREFKKCPISSLSSTVSNLVWTPNNPSGIFAFAVEGVGNPTGYRSISSMEVRPPDVGTYEIG